MSKWVDIRDAIVKELNIDNVTEEVKQRITRAILSECLPAIEQAVDKFVAQIKAQAKNEKGWCVRQYHRGVHCPGASALGLIFMLTILR